MSANIDLITQAGNIGARSQDRLRSLVPQSGSGFDTYKLMMEMDKNKASIASSEASAKTSKLRGEKLTLETLDLKKEASLAHMQGAGESPETLERAKAAHLRDPVTKDIPIPPELETWTPETPAIINQMMMKTIDMAKQAELRLREQDMTARQTDRTLTREQDQSQFAKSEANKESRSLRSMRSGSTGSGASKSSEFDRTMAAAEIDPGSEQYVKAARIKAGLESKPSSVDAGKPQTPANAGRLAMVKQAKKDVQGAREIAFKDGVLDRGVLARAQAPFTAGIGGDARMLRSKIENSVSAKYRLETGAAGNQGEIESIASRFMPTPLDTDDSANDKLDRLENFMDMTLEEAVGAGYIDASKAPNTPRTPVTAVPQEVDFNDLP